MILQSVVKNYLESLVSILVFLTNHLTICVVPPKGTAPLHFIIMKGFKRAFRVLTLVFLMMLALVGIGLGGAIPVVEMKRKQEKTISNEQVDELEENL